MTEQWGAQPIPNSVEAEEAVLGSILTNPEKYAVVRGFLKTTDFFILRNQYIWQALDRLQERRESIDFLTVIAELKAIGRFEEIGGVVYLTQLVNNTPTSIHAETYGRMVQRAALRRTMLHASDAIRSLALDEEITTDHARAEMAKLTAEINGVDITGQRRGLRELLNAAFARVEDRMNNPDAMLGIPTGFRDLDNLLLGMQKTDLTIVGAVPGMGKTSWMLSVALNMARRGVRVGFVSQEMGDDQITNRLLSLESAVNLQAVRSGNMNASEFARYTRAGGNIANLDKNFIIDQNTVTPDVLRGKVMKWAGEGGIDVLFVDYLQIMSSGGLFKPSERVQAVGYFARSLKELAREMRIPVIAAAQLNREIANRQDKRPYLSDLRESGEIEQSADVVLFIHRDDYYNPASERPNAADIIIGKHRNGPTGEITLHFEKTLTKFSNSMERTVDLSYMGAMNDD